MGGKCLVNGTVYNILKGRTLIGGTGYDINFEPDVSLTWYFNETIDITSQPDNFWGIVAGLLSALCLAIMALPTTILSEATTTLTV